MQISTTLRERMVRQITGASNELAEKLFKEHMATEARPGWSAAQGEFVQGGGRVVFVIFEVANGYTANVNGTTIIGKTLSECCDAAQAEAASQAATREQDGPAMDPDSQKAEKFQWKPKLQRFATINPRFDRAIQQLGENAAEEKERVIHTVLTDPSQDSYARRMLRWFL